MQTFLHLFVSALIWSNPATLAEQAVAKQLASSHATKLELVQLVLRHGERTTYAYETYPGDPYRASHFYEPGGRGQLTDQGRWRVYRLAQAVRREYGELLAEPGYAYSLDRDACRDSARLLIGELYGPHALRLESRPEHADALLNLRACSTYRRELQRVRALPEVVQMLDKYDGLYEYLNLNLGVPFISSESDGSTRDQRLYELYSVLEIQRALNFSLPGWCTEGVYSLLRELTYIHYNLESQSKALRRLNGGPLLRRFLELARRPGAQGLHLIVAEDRHVAGLGRAVQPPGYPPVPDFGAGLALEKRRDLRSGEIFVRLSAWTGVVDGFFALKLRGCAREDCTLAEFLEIAKAALPAEHELRCLETTLPEWATTPRQL